jgi:phage/plasmid-like protein (TIGR03299 family)
MSHEVETMAYANQVPWHGLGVQVEEDITTEEMLVKAGLDWKVNMLPIYTTNPETGEVIDITKKKAVMRTSDNAILSIAGHNWKPVQNDEIIGFMRDYVSAGGATLETAGSLKNGKVIWGLARVDYDFEVVPGDKVNGYMLITGSHEPGRATTVRATTVRVVCANTMAAAEAKHAKNPVIYRQNHRSEFDVKSAQSSVESVCDGLAAAQRRFQTIEKLKISTEDAINKVYMPVLGFSEEQSDEIRKGKAKLPRQLKQILSSYHNAPGANTENGWGVLNGFTHWMDHTAGHNASTRMTKAWIGTGVGQKIDVENRLLELAA